LIRLEDFEPAVVENDHVFLLEVVEHVLRHIPSAQAGSLVNFRADPIAYERLSGIDSKSITSRDTGCARGIE